MTATPPADGRARKSLADQIDRLDAILDGLAEALSGAVADTVREAVGLAVTEAVRAVLAEVLTNPAFAARLADRSAAPPPPAGPAWRDRLRAAGRIVRTTTAATAGWLGRQLARSAVVAAHQASAAAAGFARWYRAARAAVPAAAAVATRYRNRVAAAVAAGVLVGVGCYL